MQLCRWRALCTHASRHGHKPTILPHCSSQPTCNYATDLHHEGSESETDEGTQGFPGIVQFVKAGTTFRFRRRRRHRIVTRPSGAVEALAITMPAEPSHYVPSGVTGTKALQSTSRTSDDIAVQRIVPLQQVFSLDPQRQRADLLEVCEVCFHGHWNASRNVSLGGRV